MASEKLALRNDIKISVELARQLMIQARLWQANVAKKEVVKTID